MMSRDGYMHSSTERPHVNRWHEVRHTSTRYFDHRALKLDMLGIVAARLCVSG
jgi:hypothetical protein